MDEEKLKQAFAKAKQDIFSLYSELDSIRRELHEIKFLIKSQLDRQTDTSTDNPTHNPAQNTAEISENTTIQHINPTENNTPTHNPAHNLPFKALKSQNSSISTGNEGVPTNRQTDKQTNTSTRNQGVKVRFNQENPQLTNVSNLINSLDTIKKELRQKLKKLTNQEMTVFSTIYQLEEEGFIVDYSSIAKKLSLTESSIRDYIQRIIKKGIPVLKTKENNKKILISISPDLKKLASLSIIMQLREL